jgi:anti-sigma B factor antagonist
MLVTHRCYPRRDAAKPLPLSTRRSRSGRLGRLQRHFRVEVRQGTGARVLSLFGELDLASSATLEQELAKAGTAPLTIIDLQKLEFIDSTGLSLLVRAHQRAHEEDRGFGLINGRGQVQRLLDLTGLAARLRVADAPERLLSGS